MRFLIAVVMAVAWCGAAFALPRYYTPTTKYDLYVIAGGWEKGQFPPGLNTVDHPTELAPDETSDGYGFDLTTDGVLAKGTIPSGTGRIALTTNVSGTIYYWYFHRLWRYTGSTLIYGAQFYNDVYTPQALGKMFFNEDSEPIITVVPFGLDSMAVVKSTGSYVLNNLSDSRGFFQRGDILQELYATNASNATEMDGVVYASNGNGLTAYNNGQTAELTRKVRNNLTGLTHLALTCDYVKHRVLGGSVLAYDAESKKLFKYSGSAFRFTSRQFHTPDYRPINVDRLLFTIVHPTTVNGNLKYQIKWEDEPWSPEYTVLLPYLPGSYTVVSESLAEARSVYRISVRITDINGGKQIKEIRLDTQSFNADDFVM